jgi:starvation-inducible DNA-binding protein
LLFDDEASQIFATTDMIAERVRKLGSQTLKSISQVARLQRIADNESDSIAARDIHPAGTTFRISNRCIYTHQQGF